MHPLIDVFNMNLYICTNLCEHDHAACKACACCVCFFFIYIPDKFLFLCLIFLLILFITVWTCKVCHFCCVLQQLKGGEKNKFHGVLQACDLQSELGQYYHSRYFCGIAGLPTVMCRSVFAGGSLLPMLSGDNQVYIQVSSKA